MKGPAVFLDKDGTLVEDLPWNVDPDRIRLLPGVRESLPALVAAGYRLVLVTNQAGIARGYFPEAALAAVEARLRQLLAVPLAGFYYCPHDPRGSLPAYALACGCRKPAPGLLRRAARELDLDLSASWLVGDILNDIEAGRRAGCRTLLVDNGGETEWKFSALRRPHHIAADFTGAAAIILADTESTGVQPAVDKHGGLL